jgi:hypothetical protein
MASVVQSRAFARSAAKLAGSKACQVLPRHEVRRQPLVRGVTGGALVGAEARQGHRVLASVGTQGMWSVHERRMRPILVPRAPWSLK